MCANNLEHTHTNKSKYKFVFLKLKKNQMRKIFSNIVINFKETSTIGKMK